MSCVPFLVPLFGQCADHEFETLGLFGRGEAFRLCSNGFLWLGREQVPFHGDLVIRRLDAEFVCRFYSGSLEWIRPMSEISIAVQRLLGMASKGISRTENAAPSPPTVATVYGGNSSKAYVGRKLARPK